MESKYVRVKGKDGTWFLLDGAELVRKRKFEGTLNGNRKFLGAYPDEASAAKVKDQMDKALKETGRFVMPKE